MTPSTAPKSGGGSNAAGIAAGVVVGIIAVAAIGGGFFFYKRRQRNKEKEEDERRNASIGAFVGRGHPPSSSGGSDARLDPVMAQRRMSSGSIEDNQDYSRKILRVGSPLALAMAVQIRFDMLTLAQVTNA